MDNEKFLLRAALVYEYRKGTSVADTYRNVKAVFGEASITERQCYRWFAKFRSGNFSVFDEPRPGRPSAVDSDQLIALLENNPSETTRDLAFDLGVDDSTINRHLHELGFISKLDRWVPHSLSDHNKITRLTTCATLLARQNCEPFLDRIVTCDEKWVFYENKVRSRSWCRKDQASRAVAKKPMHGKKTMLSVWWDIRGIVHFEFLPPGQTINTVSYCDQLDRVALALREKRPVLINRKGVIYHQDNARPHISRPTIDKIVAHGWEIMSHPPYSPDLAPSDYHLFRALQNDLDNRQFTNQAEVRTHVSAYLNSLPPEFFKKGIGKLVQNWQNVIACDGDYFLNE